MAEQSLVYNNSSGATLELAVDSIENKLAELFDDSYYIVNIKNGRTGCINMRYLFATSQADINPEVFDEEEIKKLPKTARLGDIYMIGFDEKDPKHTAVEYLDVQELTALIENAYMSRTFMARDIYDILRDLACRVCDKYFPDCKVFRELLERSNTVLSKDGTAVIATVETSDSNTRFYETTMKVDENTKISLLLNFGSPDYSSVYDKPSNELFGIKADGHITDYQKPADMKNITYELCVTNPGLNEVLVITMSSDGQYFNVNNISSQPDYRGLKDIIDNNYNNADKIINKIMEYNINSHTEDLLDLID